MTISISANADGISGAIKVSGVDRLLFNTDATLSALAAPTPADLNTKKLPTMDLFGAQRTANGYQKLPSGLIIQWGVTGAMSGSPYASVTITYPIAFPSVALLAVATSQGAGVSAAIAGTTSQTQLTITNSTASTSQAAWIAIGY